MSKKLTARRERVVLSLQFPKAQHVKLVRAARKSKASVAGFIRDAAERYADDVLGVSACDGDETAADAAA